MDKVRLGLGFLARFDGVFSSRRNVFPITFLRVKKQNERKKFICGGASKSRLKSFAFFAANLLGGFVSCH
jgi:hypothetical protein